MHAAADVQEIPSSAVIPAGTICGAQLAPPLVVERMAGPSPIDDEPIAKQSRTFAHEIPMKFVTVAGKDSVVQVLPPLVVPIMLGVPALELKLLTAKQVDAFTQETAVSRPTPDGTGLLTHVTPPFVVPMMTGFEKMPKPTAVHCEGEMQEMLVRPSTSVETL
jgi:hypothetical protein